MKRPFNSHFGTWKCWKGFIASYYFEWYWVVYFQNMLNISHTTDWFHLCCYFGFAKNNRSVYTWSVPGQCVPMHQVPTSTGYCLLLTVPDTFVTTFNWCPWKINCREAILVSLQECWNLAVSSCTGTLITKGKELNSKLGLCSVRHN